MLILIDVPRLIV